MCSELQEDLFKLISLKLWLAACLIFEPCAPCTSTSRYLAFITAKNVSSCRDQKLWAELSPLWLEKHIQLFFSNCILLTVLLAFRFLLSEVIFNFSIMTGNIRLPIAIPICWPYKKWFGRGIPGWSELQRDETVFAHQYLYYGPCRQR